MLGTLSVDYSGMDLAFNGAPGVSGSLASELGVSELEDLRAGVQPLLLLTLIALVAGGVLSAVLPNPLARTISALAAAGLSLLLAGINQLGLQGLVRAAIQEEAGAELQLVDYQTSTGAGFWLVFILLLGVIAYNVVDLVLLRRGPGPRMMTAGGLPPGGPVPPGFGPPGAGFQGPGPRPGPQGTGPHGTGLPGPGPQGNLPPQGFGPPRPSQPPHPGQRPPQGAGLQGTGPQGQGPQGPGFQGTGPQGAPPRPPQGSGPQPGAGLPPQGPPPGQRPPGPQPGQRPPQPPQSPQPPGQPPARPRFEGPPEHSDHRPADPG